MRFTFAEALTDPGHFVPLAQAAEAAGWTSMTVADSLIFPDSSDTAYPYTPDGDREFLRGKEVIETTILCAHLFAQTSTLRPIPFVLKLPVRPPVLVAKQIGSLAVLSRNRLAVGVGLSPWPEDFTALGVPWERRGRRMDECIDIVRGLTSGEFFGFSGEFYDFAPVQQLPAPTQPIPLLVGGHSDAALLRAVRKGDGWMHAGGRPGELEVMLERLRGLRALEGDDRPHFQIHAGSADAYTAGGVEHLQELGVTDCVVAFRNPYARGRDEEPLEAKIGKLERYAEKVIARFRP